LNWIELEIINAQAAQPRLDQIPNAKNVLILSLGGPASTVISHILQRLD